jgi:hypothetical protein
MCARNVPRGRQVALHHGNQQRRRAVRSARVHVVQGRRRKGGGRGWGRGRLVVTMLLLLLLLLLLLRSTEPAHQQRLQDGGVSAGAGVVEERPAAVVASVEVGPAELEEAEDFQGAPPGGAVGGEDPEWRGRMEKKWGEGGGSIRPDASKVVLFDGCACFCGGGVGAVPSVTTPARPHAFLPNPRTR